MAKKIIDEIIDICIYYACALLICLVFKWIKLTEDNIFELSISITIGWYIAQLIIRFVKKQKKIK